jgi:hypothetical protein
VISIIFTFIRFIPNRIISGGEIGL